MMTREVCYDYQYLQYVLQQRDDQEILRSQGFPGLQVAVEALLAGDMQRVLTVAT